jgi:hypothetical protein
MPKEKQRKNADPDTEGKRIVFDRETLHALILLARDRTSSLQELADEAFRDLLKKHNRPTDLRAQLKQSVKQIAANDERPPSGRKR